MKKVVRVGGVPEHFNLAWHLAIEDGSFAEKGIEIVWHNVPGGTGAMGLALRENELDLAVALTDGIIADIMKGNPSRLVQFYVNSPLRWGIFVSSASDIYSVDQIGGKKYAISRFNSGSHLMAYLNARNHNLKISEADFVEVGDLTGARKALAQNTAQIFMWEKFTTKPLVDAGEFRMIGECRPTWPSFSIVATNSFLEQKPRVLQEVLEIINQACRDLRYHQEAAAMVAWRYQIKEADARQWLSELEYAYEPDIDEHRMLDILHELKSLKLIDRIPMLEDICYHEHLETI